MPHPDYHLGEGPGDEPYDHTAATAHLWEVYGGDSLAAPPGSDAWMQMQDSTKGTPVGGALHDTANAVNSVVDDGTPNQ